MAKAIWHDAVLADSDHTEKVEGNAYFPPASLDCAFLEPSEHTSVCGWKGTAHYYHVVVNGEKNQNAAWYYPEPKPEASNIKNFVAFWKGVRIEA